MVYGFCAGVIFAILIMTGSLVVDCKAEEKRYKKEIRKAHDRGYADGRRWRGIEKMWLEQEFELLRADIDDIRKRGKEQ